MRDEDRRIVDQYRQRDIGTVERDAKHAFFGDAAGAVIGFVWFAAFHFGDRGAFDADAERLAEGGVKDLLDYLLPALKTEGCDLGASTEAYDARHGYTLTIGAEQHTMWSESEAEKSWDLTTRRAAALVNERLERAGSQERLHLLPAGRTQCSSC